MNDKIKELIPENMIKYYDAVYTDSICASWNLKEYTEMIIRQCAEIAEDYDGAHYIGTAIKQHFGVK